MKNLTILFAAALILVSRPASPQETNMAGTAFSSGTVTSVGIANANGIIPSGSPVTGSGSITLSLGDITPTSVNGLTLANAAGATSITGNTGNMTIVSGTGNSRTLILKTTTSGGTATTALTLNADQTATFANDVTSGGSYFMPSNQKVGWTSNTRLYANGNGGLNIDNASDAVQFATGTGGLVTTYGGVATAGNGLSQIVASGHQEGVNATTVADLCHFTPTADGTYQVSGHILQTTAGIGSAINFNVAFTDEGNTARTRTLPMWNSSSAIVNTTGNNTQTYMVVSSSFRVKANTSITLSTGGTFTSTTYNVSGVIKQIQ